jgi:uncharacterized protein (TIGR03067 family)
MNRGYQEDWTMRSALMICLLAIAAPDRPDLSPLDNRPLQEKIRGEWQMIGSVINGETQDPNTHRATVYTFSPDRLVTRSMKQPDGVIFGVIIDEARKPAHIDFLAGNNEPKTRYPGIFKIDGDLLTLCFTRSVTGQRPADFTSPADPQQMIALFQLRRIGK